MQSTTITYVSIYQPEKLLTKLKVQEDLAFKAFFTTLYHTLKKS